MTRTIRISPEIQPPSLAETPFPLTGDVRCFWPLSQGGLPQQPDGEAKEIRLNHSSWISGPRREKLFWRRTPARAQPKRQGAQHGGGAGVRDEGLLELAHSRPKTCLAMRPRACRNSLRQLIISAPDRLKTAWPRGYLRALSAKARAFVFAAGCLPLLVARSFRRPRWSRGVGPKPCQLSRFLELVDESHPSPSCAKNRSIIDGNSSLRNAEKASARDFSIVSLTSPPENDALPTASPQGDFKMTACFSSGRSAASARPRRDETDRQMEARKPCQLTRFFGCGVGRSVRS